MGFRFLVDEDLSRSTTVELRRAGCEAFDVRDVGLRGATDPQVFAFAQAEQLTVVTADVGFANVIQFPLGTHFGIVVLRIPNEVPTRRVNEELVRTVVSLGSESLRGILVIVELGRVRIRRA